MFVKEGTHRGFQTSEDLKVSFARQLIPLSSSDIGKRLNF
jgi:hypothetical protein